MDYLLSYDEVARILGLSKRTVKQMALGGKLKSVKINDRGDRRFRTEDVQQFINDRTKTDYD